MEMYPLPFLACGTGWDVWKEESPQDQGKVGMPSPLQDGDIISLECPVSISAFQCLGQ